MIYVIIVERVSYKYTVTCQFYRLNLFVTHLKTGCLIYIICNGYQVYHIYFRRSYVLNTHIQLENVQLFTDD